MVNNLITDVFSASAVENQVLGVVWSSAPRLVQPHIVHLSRRCQQRLAQSAQRTDYAIRPSPQNTRRGLLTLVG